MHVVVFDNEINILGMHEASKNSYAYLGGMYLNMEQV